MTEVTQSDPTAYSTVDPTTTLWLTKHIGLYWCYFTLTKMLTLTCGFINDKTNCSVCPLVGVLASLMKWVQLRSKLYSRWGIITSIPGLHSINVKFYLINGCKRYQINMIHVTNWKIMFHLMLPADSYLLSMEEVLIQNCGHQVFACIIYAWINCKNRLIFNDCKSD